MGKARSFSDDSEEANYQKQFDDELYNYSQQNSYNLGSVHFSDQSGIGNFSQSGSDQRKADLDGALFRGNLGFILDTAVLDVTTSTINLLEDGSSNPLPRASIDKIVILSSGNTADLITILGVQRIGQRLRLYNIDTITITIKNTGSAIDNTIFTPGGDDFVLSGNAVVDLTYDITNAKWRVVGGSATGGGGEFFGPWTADHDAGTFNLKNFDSLIFQAGTPDGLAITDTGITGGDAFGIKANFLVGKEFFITEAGENIFDVQQGFMRTTSKVAAPTVIAYFNDASPIGGNEVGSIEFHGNNVEDPQEIVKYAAVLGRVNTTINDVEKGTLVLQASVAGNLTTFMELNPFGVTVGEGKVRFLRDIFLDVGKNIFLDTSSRLILNNKLAIGDTTDIRVSGLVAADSDIIIRRAGTSILQLGTSTSRALFAGSIEMNSSSASGAFIQFRELTGNPAAGTSSGKFYVKTVGTDAKPFFIGDGTAAVDLSASGTGGEFFGPWTADHDAGTFNLKNFDSLIFLTGNPDGLSASDTGITGGSTFGIKANFLVGKEFFITEAGVNIFDVQKGFMRTTSKDAAPTVIAYFDDGTPAVGNEVGSIEFHGNNAETTQEIIKYAAVLGRINTLTNNVETGTLVLQASVAGSLTTFMEINPFSIALGEGKVRFVKDIFMDETNIFLETSGRLILNNKLAIGDTTDIRVSGLSSAANIIFRREGSSILELGTATSRALFSGPIELKELTTPSNPPANRGLFYAKTNLTPGSASAAEPFWQDENGREARLDNSGYRHTDLTANAWNPVANSAAELQSGLKIPDKDVDWYLYVPTVNIEVEQMGFSLSGVSTTATEEARFNLGIYSVDLSTMLPNALLASVSLLLKVSSTGSDAYTIGFHSSSITDENLTAGTPYFIAYSNVNIEGTPLTDTNDHTNRGFLMTAVPMSDAVIENFTSTNANAPVQIGWTTNDHTGVLLPTTAQVAALIAANNILPKNSNLNAVGIFLKSENPP